FFVDEIPVAHPTPVIELSLGTSVQTDAAVFRQVAEQEPLLLLPDTDGPRVLPNELFRQTVAQPATRAGEDFHILFVKPHLLMKLPVKRGLGTFILLDAALGKLPRVMATHSARPQNLVTGIREDNSHVGAKAL